MYTFLLVLLVIDSFVLVAAILLQSGKGSGMSASFGGASSSTDSLMGSHQAGNLLTKASWWSGGLFLLLAFVLQMASSRSRIPTSVLDQPLSTAPSTAPAPAATPNAAPVVPLQPQGAAPTGQPATPQPKR